MASVNLNEALAKLEEQLEEKPDKWFKDPRGYLKKPDFKRDAQRRSSILTGQTPSLFTRMTATAFKTRWFRLDNAKKVLRYYEDNEEQAEKGQIDIDIVVDVDYSQLSDAPPFSIDLITHDLHYTLQCQSQSDMLKWALAIKRLLKSYKREKKAASKAEISKLSAPILARESESGNNTLDNGEKWYRYDYTYEEAGPIGLNVMGIANKDPKSGALLNQWVVVSSFEMGKDGQPGRSETSGTIAKDDYVVGVNGQDLTNSTFNEAFDLIKTATWPKTLHFLRDNEAAKEASRIDSWSSVFYPALNRRRRRYCEIKGKYINFRKAFPDGTVNSQRDAYFLLENIAKVQPIYDKVAADENPDQCFILQLHCKSNSQVEHVSGATDMSVGGSPVDVLELCFGDEQSMNSWRSALVSPSPYNAGGLPMENTQVIESDPGIGGSSALHTNGLYIKSSLTGKFSERDFTLANGTIFWQRPKVSGMATSERSKRSMFIADAKSCGLEKIHVFKLSGQSGSPGCNFLLKLVTKEGALSIAFSGAQAMAEWQDAIKACVAKTPALAVPSSLKFDGDGDEEDSDKDSDEEEADDVRESMNQSFAVYAGTGDDPEEELFQGYLYKRNDRSLPKGFSPNAAFAKVYVVFKANTLHVFHSRIEYTSKLGAFLQLNFNGVLEVREATDANVPENCFEVVTVEKVYTFAASDEDSLLVWLENLSDLLEARDFCVQNGTSASGTESSESERVAKIKQSIRFSGGLTMKSVNLYTGIATWRDRFVVVSYGSLAYYSESKDVYNPEKDSIGDVNLVGVVALETSREPRCATNCAFDMTAAVTKGGDEDGMRTFIFEARTPELCKQWMQELCSASETFELHPSTRVPGGFVGVRVNKNSTGQTLAARANVFSTNADAASGPGGGGGGRGTVLAGRGGGRMGGRGVRRVSTGGSAAGGGAGAANVDTVSESLRESNIAGGSENAGVPGGTTVKVEGHMKRRASTLLAKGGRGGRGAGGRGGGAPGGRGAGGSAL
jgi:hypothetical protein